MIDIAPTITAFDNHEYRKQMEQITAFAERVHIDLMDGNFAPTKSPALDSIWWPDGMQADIHLMYQHPMDYLDTLLKLKPSLVIVHIEANLDHREFSKQLHEHYIKAGLAVLQDTPIDGAVRLMDCYDHLLVFSGKLGFHGGEANLDLLQKVQQARDYNAETEIGWDGGINDQNVRQLVDAGVQVLNVGGFIQKASEPAAAYQKLQNILVEL